MSHLSPRIRWMLFGLGLSALLGAPVAIGALAGTEKLPKHEPFIAGARTPSVGELVNGTTLATNVSPFALDVTNRSNRGGSLSLGCKSIAGPGRRPCLRVNNRANGNAFDFRFRGALGGVFQVGSDILQAYPEAQPFVTNATGVATGLNSDRVDGMHAQDIIDTAVSRSSVQVGAQGPQGAQGAQGPRGPEGPRGPNGAPGAVLTAVKATPTEVALPSRLLSSTEPDSVDDGVDLLGGTIFLPFGDYIVETVVRAYDGFGPAVVARVDIDDVQYAVAGLFLDANLQSTITTPNIPNDGNNAAQMSDTTVISVGSNGATLSLRGVVRQDVSTTAPSTAQGRATVIVTEVDAG